MKTTIKLGLVASCLSLPLGAQALEFAGYLRSGAGTLNRQWPAAMFPTAGRRNPNIVWVMNASNTANWNCARTCSTLDDGSVLSVDAMASLYNKYDRELKFQGENNGSARMPQMYAQWSTPARPQWRFGVGRSALLQT